MPCAARGPLRGVGVGRVVSEASCSPFFPSLFLKGVRVRAGWEGPDAATPRPPAQPHTARAPPPSCLAPRPAL